MPVARGTAMMVVVAASLHQRRVVCFFLFFFLLFCFTASQYIGEANSHGYWPNECTLRIQCIVLENGV